jgi:hypothetical protein
MSALDSPLIDSRSGAIATKKRKTSHGQTNRIEQCQFDDLKGTLANLQAALNGLKFKPTICFSSSASLVVHDLKASGPRQTISWLGAREHRPCGRPYVEIPTFVVALRFINMEMVRDGFAWRYVQCDKRGEFTSVEPNARENRRGLWADPDLVPPWEWRKAKRKRPKAR